ncbi:MAG TPA: hypothetical protein VFE36_05730 [Candidatus Baltobacteraceae bacterium]|nr:hypothetical protein [Candidatus Baltobacteraceae bacterium]
MRATAAGLLLAALPLAAPAQTPPVPARTLVYAFESRAGTLANGAPETGNRPIGELSPDDCLTGGLKVAGRMSAAMDAGNGGIDWFQVDCKGGFGYQIRSTGQPNRGTIRVAVVREQPGSSLVVQLSENLGQSDAAGPATCVVYASTALICDPNKPVSLEEVTLLRFLAPNFVDPAKDQAHWQLQDGGAQQSFKATYSVLQNAAGVMRIGEQRTSTGDAGPYSTADSRATIVYDTGRALPTAIDDAIVQKTVRFGQYRTAQRETIFLLQQPAASR